MKRIDHATVQRILDRADIVDVVGDFVRLKRRGSGFIGLCPFHNERTPSFSVSPARNFCKCFSCGKGGSPVNFIMELEKLSYHDALRWLAHKYNIEIEEHELSPEEQQRQTERESMLAVNEWALKFFEHSIHSTDEGRDVGLAYFHQRGLSDQTIRTFHLGYSPDSRDALYHKATSAGYDEQYLTATGLCARTDRGQIYDRFRARVIYPIHSIAGKVVAFGGRTLRSDKTMAKYVNSPESAIYSKSNQLYGLYQARKSIVSHDRAILVEGYMDVISMHQSGVENVVASSGTSLTTGQIRLLRRFSRNVTVIYDSDAAGIKASLRGIDMLLAEEMNVSVVQFPPGEDPDSFARSHSSAELEQYLSGHEEDFIRFKTRVLLEGSAADPLKRAEAITDICRSIAAISDLIKRTVYIDETASTLRISPDVVSTQVAVEMAKRAEKATEEVSKESRRADLQRFVEKESTARQTLSGAQHSTAAASQHDNAASGEVTPGSEEHRRRFMTPYEHALMRYVVRYGMALLNISGGAEGAGTAARITLLDYVTDTLAAEDLHFLSPLAVKEMQAIRDLVQTHWQTDYSAFLDQLEQRISAERSRLYDDLRERAADANITVEEKKIETSIEQMRAVEDARFRDEYISRNLSSSEDDDVRRFTTDLCSDTYVLSAIHSRFGKCETERDRVNELPERAIYEWMNAILSYEIHLTVHRLSQESAREGGGDPATIMELMRHQAALQQQKLEFDKFLGERIISPK